MYMPGDLDAGAEGKKVGFWKSAGHPKGEKGEADISRNKLTGKNVRKKPYKEGGTNDIFMEKSGGDKRAIKPDQTRKFFY